MNWNKNLYGIFDLLRFPLVLLIVFMHCKGEPPSLSINWQTFGLMDVFNYFRNYVSNVISDVAVPTFFLMSGYLFYHHNKRFSFTVYKEKMYRRVRSLLVPYVFWILLYLVLDLFLVLRSSECTYGMDCINGYLRKYGYWHIFWDCNVMDSGSNNPIGFIQDSSSPLLFPLWFVRDLFVVSLFSPLLWWGVRKVGWVFIIVLGFFHVFQIWPCLHGFSSVSFFFFALGIFLNVYADNLDSYFRRFGMLVLLISVLLSLFLVYLFDTHHICLPYVVRCFTVFGSLSVLYLAYKCHDHKGVSLLISLAKGSFVVYAAHMVFISRYVRIFASHVFASGGMMFFLLEYLTVPIVISFICYLFYFSVKRFCPRLLLLINGGR